MVNTEEIVERTFYICLLQTALKKGLTLNPEDYLPLSQENEKRFQADKDAMPKFIPIYGIGNNQVKGAKTCPRITIELQGFYNYQASEFPYETKDITLDIHLVSNTQTDMRLLHSIMYEALPSRGYVRPYYNNLEEWEDGRVAPTGNLFIEIGNYYDHPDESHGLLEKVYQYTCKDGILPEKLAEEGELVPIQDISVLIGLTEKQESDLLNLNVK